MITRNGFLIIHSTLIIYILSVISSSPWFFILSFLFTLIILIEAIRFRKALKSLKNLKISRIVQDTCYVGSPLEVRLLIENGNKYNFILDEIPEGFEYLQGNINFKSTLKEGKNEIKYYLMPKELGIKKFSRVKVLVLDPLFIFFKEQTYDVESKVTCYPEIIKGLQSHLLRNFLLYSEIGSRSSKKKGEGFEFYGIREFTSSDDPRRIAWQAVAKSPERKIYIIEKEEESKNAFKIILHLEYTFKEGVEGQRKFDVIVENIIKFANLLLKQNVELDLIIFNNNEIKNIIIRKETDIVNLLENLYKIVFIKNISDFSILKNFLLDNYYMTSFLLITDRSINKIAEEEIKKIASNFNIEVIILKTLSKQIIKDDVLLIYDKIEEIILKETVNKMQNIKIKSQIIDPADLLSYLITLYNKQLIYKELPEYGKKIY